MSDLANPVLDALGSTFRRSKIGVGQITFSSGQTSSIEVPNSLLTKGLTLRLTGNLVIATNNATAILDSAPLRLIRNVQVVGDGRRVLVNASAVDLYRLCHITWQKQPELSPPPSANIGTQAFAATFRIDHEMLMAMNPVESLFDPRLYKKVELKITWGTIADICSVGTAVTSITSGQVDVLADLTGEGVRQIMFDHTITSDEQNVTATNTQFTFKVPQNGLLAGILIASTRDAGGGLGPVPVDTIVTSVTIKSDQTVVHYDAVAWATLQRENVITYDLDGGASAGAQIVGYAYCPFMEHGMISSCLNTNALNNLQVILSVTRTSGTEAVRCVYDWLEPRRSLAQAITAA